MDQGAVQLSNESVKAAWEDNGCEIFRKALAWSQAVNEAVTKLPGELKKPFAGAREGLLAAHEAADVAIVSSANKEAVKEEWEKFGLNGLGGYLPDTDRGKQGITVSGR